jgi:hypothetical protein
MASVSFAAVSKRYNDVVAVDTDERRRAGEMLAYSAPRLRKEHHAQDGSGY